MRVTRICFYHKSNNAIRTGIPIVGGVIPQVILNSSLQRVCGTHGQTAITLLALTISELAAQLTSRVFDMLLPSLVAFLRCFRFNTVYSSSRAHWYYLKHNMKLSSSRGKGLRELPCAR